MEEKRFGNGCDIDSEQRVWEFAEPPPALTASLMEEASVTRPIGMVLASRGVTTENVHQFLHPSLENMGDPYLLSGTKAAAKRLWEAIQKNERIMIHGDYDTDGITATALLAWVLRENGAQVSCYLPHRIDDGYGLTADSINKNAKGNCDLLVTVDCGITSYDAVDAARAINLDLIITDHHTPGPTPLHEGTGGVGSIGLGLPPNAGDLDTMVVVDPKLPGAPKETEDLAGVGVAYKVAQAFLKYGRENGIGGEDTNLHYVLDLVALGTVADIVPLLNENRILVQPHDVAAVHNFGICLKRGGHFDDAAKIFMKAAKMTSDNEPHLLEFADCAAAAQHHEDAIKVLETLKKKRPDDRELDRRISKIKSALYRKNIKEYYK